MLYCNVHMYEINVVRFTGSLLPGDCSSCPTTPTGELTFAQTPQGQSMERWACPPRGAWWCLPLEHPHPFPKPWSLLPLPLVWPPPVWIRSHQATPSGSHDLRTFLTARRDTVATNAAGRPLCPAVCHSSSVPAPALSQQTSLTKHKSKIKLRLSRWWKQNMKPNVGHFSAEVSGDYTGHMATKLALSTREKGDSERLMNWHLSEWSDC